MCIIVVDGEVVHAVHKNPALWGWHKDTCLCSGSLTALEAAVCTCSGAAADRGVVDACVSRHARSNYQEYEAAVPAECAAAFNRAPVEALMLPLPESMAAVVRAALVALPGFSDG